MKHKRFFLAIFFLLFLFARLGYSIEPVVIEFFYYEPCAKCPIVQGQYEIYEHNSKLLENIKIDYGERVLVKRTPFYSEEGLEGIKQYGVGLGDCNTIVVNFDKVFLGLVNDTYLRETVDEYLQSTTHDVAVSKVTLSRVSPKNEEAMEIHVIVKNLGAKSESFDVEAYCNETVIGTQSVADLGPSAETSLTFIWEISNQIPGRYFIRIEADSVTNETNLSNNNYVYGPVDPTSASSSNVLSIAVLAFSFGFFETFSPCLIILLSFVLSYAISESPCFKKSFLKVMLFALGFLCASLLLGMALGVFLSTPIFQFSISFLICIFALFFGFYLFAAPKVVSYKTPFKIKHSITQLAKKYAGVYPGLFMLGFVFYFLDPCIAPIFVSITPILFPEAVPFALFVFGLGVIFPFIGLGIFAGSISKIARSTYKHRLKIRAASGLILIGYAIYLLFFYLIPRFT